MFYTETNIPCRSVQPGPTEVHRTRDSPKNVKIQNISRWRQ